MTSALVAAAELPHARKGWLAVGHPANLHGSGSEDLAIKADEFEILRAWSAIFMEQVRMIPPSLPPESHPIAVLDAMARSSPARARQGLAMMIGDLMELTVDFPQEEIARLDAILGEAQLPTLSNIRVRFMKRIKSIVRRGLIRSEAEYYLVRNAVEGVNEVGEQDRLWAMLVAYEQKLAR
jgi:hypothetical protein